MSHDIQSCFGLAQRRTLSSPPRRPATAAADADAATSTPVSLSLPSVYLSILLPTRHRPARINENRFRLYTKYAMRDLEYLSQRWNWLDFQ